MKKILLVDDSENFVELCKRLLELLKEREIHTAANGKIGLEKAMAIQPDLILMDMHMPVMDGYQAVRSLREQGYKGIIIACTSVREYSDILEAGCDGIIEKPFDPDNLLDTIESRLTPSPEGMEVLSP